MISLLEGADGSLHDAALGNPARKDFSLIDEEPQAVVADDLQRVLAGLRDFQIAAPAHRAVFQGSVRPRRLAPIPLEGDGRIDPTQARDVEIGAPAVFADE